MKRRMLVLGTLAAAGAAALPVDGGVPLETDLGHGTLPEGLEGFSGAAPGRTLQLLFIHHSCGGQLLAAAGRESERTRCIYASHPNGGGLRARLQTEGYEVHEASYGSDVGEATDLFDWTQKFRDKMSKILTVDENDRLLPLGRRNDVVLFKSCFPNSAFVSEGEAPGSVNGAALTVWNARAAMGSLLGEFAKHPEVLFVYLTAPPLAPRLPPERLYRWAYGKISGTGSAKERHASAARLARHFNRWVSSPNGWLAGYPLMNVAVFDYYDVLTEHGVSNLSRFPTGDGYDSHPSSDGNQAAADALVPFLNRAVRRAALVS